MMSDTKPYTPETDNTWPLSLQGDSVFQLRVAYDLSSTRASPSDKEREHNLNDITQAYMIDDVGHYWSKRIHFTINMM